METTIVPSPPLINLFNRVLDEKRNYSLYSIIVHFGLVLSLTLTKFLEKNIKSTSSNKGSTKVLGNLMKLN